MTSGGREEADEEAKGKEMIKKIRKGTGDEEEEKTRSGKEPENFEAKGSEKEKNERRKDQEK